MEFEKLISKRYSVRKFKEEPLSEKIINKVLKAAKSAPTGCNYQPQRVLVINSAEALEKLKGCTKCHFNAPCAFLICHNKEESWVRPYDKALSSPVDAAIVSTYMMLSLHNEGAGCCWVMHFNPENIKKEFNIPENTEPVALLVAGYPSESSEPLDMHFKSKSEEDFVFYETF